jgi:hypothetical protein
VGAPAAALDRGGARLVPPRPAACPAPQGAARPRALTARPPCRPSHQQHLDAPRVPSAEGHRAASLCKPSDSVGAPSPPPYCCPYPCPYCTVA